MRVILAAGCEKAATERLRTALAIGEERRDVQLLLHQLLMDLDIQIAGYGSHAHVAGPGPRYRLVAEDADA